MSAINLQQYYYSHSALCYSVILKIQLLQYSVSIRLEEYLYLHIMYVNLNIFKGKGTIYVTDSIELSSFDPNPLIMDAYCVANSVGYMDCGYCDK